MEKTPVNPPPPHMAGLTWRTVNRDDLPALVDLAARCHQADGGLAFMNEPDILIDHYFPGTPGASIGVFRAGEELVASAAVHLIRGSGTQRAMIVGQVRPEWRNRGIGTYLMRWSQKQAHCLFSADNVAKRLLVITTETLTESTRRLYLVNNFEPVMEELVMRRDLHLPIPDCPMPPDVTIMSWKPALADLFFQAYQASFRERPGFPDISSTEWISWLIDDENYKPEWSLLARAGDIPVGFLTAGTEGTGGFIIQIGVITRQRRRGIGTALLVETMRRMSETGVAVAQLTANFNNPGAIQAFAQLDFAIVGRRARYERIDEQ